MNILLVATSSWAGMGPYASEIINTFSQDKNVYFFTVEDERHFFSKNISKEMKKMEEYFIRPILSLINLSHYFGLHVTL